MLRQGGREEDEPDSAATVYTHLARCGKLGEGPGEHGEEPVQEGLKLGRLRVRQADEGRLRGPHSILIKMLPFAGQHACNLCLLVKPRVASANAAPEHQEHMRGVQYRKAASMRQ